MTGTTSEPLRCSWPMARSTPRSHAGGPGRRRPPWSACCGKPVAEGAVGIAQAEPGDHLGVVDLAAGQVGQRLGRLQQGGVVVVDDLGEHRLVLGRDVEGEGSFGSTATAWPPAHPGPGVITGAAPARSTSTAWRKLTPWVRITQSMAEPPTWQAPMQCQRPFDGVTTATGCRRRGTGSTRPGRPRPSSAPPPTGSPARPGPPPSSAARSPRLRCGPRAPPPKNFPR